jgi:DNA-binding NarL/FixJ family response regulator
MTLEPAIRAMVIGGSPIVRAGMAALLGQADDIQVVATADDPARALDRAPELGVDVTVVSPEGLDMGTAGWFESLADCRVVVLTDAIDELLVRAVSSSDVDACLQLASVTALELASTVRGVLQGQVTFSSDFLPRLVRRRQDDPLPAPLTAREGDILALLTHGHTNDSIAHVLGLSTGTVRIYVSAVLAKLGAPNRTAAAVLAVQERLVDPSDVPVPAG